MITEDESKNKWCPMARTCYTDEREGSSVSNRNIDHKGNFSTYGARCLGSDCMMWRWLDDGKVRVYEDPSCDSWTKKSRMGNDFTTIYYWEKDNPNRKGYCGLSGTPMQNGG